ncbi:N-acetyltransferase family protein [Peribacillus sp. NPDC097675]|uniref:GNAT family N-acetyltransferase n=1 Tax=Peribacillus sp. NPDC097675 TaxID=3390618 RepID=UPI003CFBE245
MNEDIEFREAVIEDLPKIVDIYNSTIASRMVTADTEPITVESRLKWFDEHSIHKRPLYIITYEGKTAGWMSFQSFYGRPAYDSTAEISIYLDDDFRGKGIGQTSIQKAIEVSPNVGVKTLLGFIFAHNKPSINLFSKFGFEKWAHLPKVAELDGVERDLVILGKRVTT